MGGIPVTSPMYNEEEEEDLEENNKESFFDDVEEEESVPEEEIKEEEDVYKGASRKIDIDLDEDFEDPLDKPAFMRRMFKGKKKE